MVTVLSTWSPLGIKNRVQPQGLGVESKTSHGVSQCGQGLNREFLPAYADCLRRVLQLEQSGNREFAEREQNGMPMTLMRADSLYLNLEDAKEAKYSATE
jgi:hypothetical protein